MEKQLVRQKEEQSKLKKAVEDAMLVKLLAEARLMVKALAPLVEQGVGKQCLLVTI
tara:strand:+ start:751 stop:918 length:168 start_codon:yes stop_codon:yes gene_type:complete